MDHMHDFYIGGDWVTSAGADTIEVVNPATEEPIGTIAAGTATDVDRAVLAARAAFDDYAATTREERIELLTRIIETYERRMPDIADTVRQEIGAPAALALRAHAAGGLANFANTLEVLRSFAFEQRIGSTTVVYEPVGVCSFITPWNWPLNQITAKVAPALAAGCTMVLKPSEVAPLNGLVFAEILDEAGLPAGVFNLVNGDGPTVGAALSSHPEVDMVSFTGSTRAGIEVATNAAPTVKRVTQELGGKSASILLKDADFEQAIARDVTRMFMNSGQSCNATSRMLVPADRMDDAIAIARAVAEQVTVGDPEADGVDVGPVVSQTQFDRVQGYLHKGVEEGATVVAGGPGRPDGLDTGYYVKPTIFANVTNDMAIAREEIFGPVLTLIAYRDEDDAVRIANDSPYGLGGAVSSKDTEHARLVARRIRTGMVHLNGTPVDRHAPFGGYKQSGNGREFGTEGLREFLEAKSIFGDGE